jgi:hypothetical protein
MGSYGLTPQGVVIKRLDVILDEVNDDLTEGFGVNTRTNPQSILNVLITKFGNMVAELWEYGESIYHNTYPQSAEDIHLDNAMSFGGVQRENAQPSVYPMHCECVDGTVITVGTTVRTSTNPSVNFIARNATAVTRVAFNSVRVIIASVTVEGLYTVAINGTLYSYNAGATPTVGEILQGLATAITDTNFTTSLNDNALVLSDVDLQRSNELALSGNLTTQTVTGIVNFSSEENGDILFPNGTINTIVTAPEGLLNVINQVPYIAGRVRQSDVGFRKSYVDKIFARSMGMLDSIKSAILQNVQGVRSVVCYQNDTNVEDSYGRWPHSVEVVADGGSDFEIATQIWAKKAAGISTFGSTEVQITADEGELVTVRFNRPEMVYIWFRVTIGMTSEQPLPPNYVEAISDIIVDVITHSPPGRSIIPQRDIDGRVFREVPGIGSIITESFSTTNPSEQPTDYSAGVIEITPRQKGFTEDTRIEVILGGT